ncbi:S41 family peptidase [Hyphococcus flavus]|uniref:S41 family peptidase n=1 Tax=Hyphococcus flavus TaxID=1866326 RepID=A0AAF0CHV4_9PROT|nr:S41 family peptidase [Hyphococcus flavus]WDI32292.1 S41 family peptidase [Hyphococcus flavus]
MWKLLGGGFAAFIVLILALAFYLSDKIYLRDQHRTVPPSDFGREYSSPEIREDLAFLTSTIQKIHPDFESIGGDEFQTHAIQLNDSLTTPLTRVEAYRQLSSLNQYLLDGHTYLRAPAEERRFYESNGGLYPPLTVKIAGNCLIADRVLAEELNIESGDIIVSINDVPARTLVDFSLASQSGESLALRRAYAEKYYYRDVWAMGLQSPFRFSIERNGSLFMVTHSGITNNEFMESRDTAAPGNAFNILDGQVGLLTFNDMPAPDNEFKNFVRASFAELNEARAETLIIDMRENGGGDSRAGDFLMTYLTEQKLPAIEYIDVKVTEEIKDYYRTLLPEGFKWLPVHSLVPVLRSIQDTPPGESFRFHPDAEAPRARKKQPENSFDGDIYVLIGPRTYSSAVIFAAPLKHFGKAVFVGEETGEPLIFFGENYYFDLPNTRLQAQVSHKKFALVGAQDARTGIEPDILATENALDAALKAIADK